MFWSSGIGWYATDWNFTQERGMQYVAILNLEILKGQHNTS